MQVTKKYIKTKYLGAFFGGVDSGKDALIKKITIKEISPFTPFYSNHLVRLSRNYNNNREQSNSGYINRDSILNYRDLEKDSNEQYLDEYSESVAENIFDYLFCFVKFDRIPIMREQLRLLILPLINYLEIIVIVVTDFQLSQDKQDEELLQKHIKDYFRVKDIIITNNNESKDELIKKFNLVFKKIDDSKIIKISKQQLKFNRVIKDDEYQKQLSLLNQMTQKATQTLNNQARGNRFTYENQKQLVKSYSQAPQLNINLNKNMTYLMDTRYNRLSKQS